MIEIINGNTYERLSPVMHRLAGYLMIVYCPGCEDTHQVAVDHPNNNQAKWGWDGNVDKPTFTPSVLVRAKFFLDRPESICHSFIRNGQWEYLNDCTHKLAGKIVPLPVIPREEEGA